MSRLESGTRKKGMGWWGEYVVKGIHIERTPERAEAVGRLAIGAGSGLPFIMAYAADMA